MKILLGTLFTILTTLLVLFGASLLEGLILWIAYPSVIKLFPILGCWLPLSINYWNAAMLMAFLNLMFETIIKLWKK